MSGVKKMEELPDGEEPSCAFASLETSSSPKDPTDDPGPVSLSAPTPSLSREAVAGFVLRHESRIRAIARRKLTAATRSTFDSEDVMASVLRRMDKLAMEGVLRPRSEGELWSLIQTIASNTAVSKTRLIERARILLTEDGSYAYEFLSRLNRCNTDDEAQLLVLRIAGALTGDRDRQIFLARIRGASHHAIAGILKISEAACRQSWMRICRDLFDAFQSEVSHA